MPSGKPILIKPFNPLDKAKLGESVADALLLQSVIPLPPKKPFIGAGVYAIYYKGDFFLYKEMAKYNRQDKCGWPIYIGKAVPAGARKGGYGLDSDPGIVLFKRLSEHAGSIEQARNLNLKDFHCRFLVVDDIWIPLAESMLIEMYLPLWNMRIDGFGNHDPGSGRYNQQKSAWDVIHPGRQWANNLKKTSINERELEKIVFEYALQMKDKFK